MRVQDKFSLSLVAALFLDQKLKTQKREILYKISKDERDNERSNEIINKSEQNNYKS